MPRHYTGAFEPIGNEGQMSRKRRSVGASRHKVKNSDSGRKTKFVAQQPGGGLSKEHQGIG